MKKPKRMNRRQAPGPDYQFTLDDLQRMVEQLGGRFSCQIYPKELDDVPAAPHPARTEEPEMHDDEKNDSLTRGVGRG